MNQSARNDHRDAKLTLREAFELYYMNDERHPETVRTYHNALQRWEIHTNNPPLADITNETVEQFRREALKVIAPMTLKGYWARLRAIFRRMAPPDTGNPLGLSVIERVPVMGRIKVVHKRPRRIKLDDLGRFYRACAVAEFPRIHGIPPAYWWRVLVVVDYFTGLRKGDVMNLRFSQFDFEELTVDFTASKTSKEDLFPLHPVAAAHLRQILRPPRQKVFAGIYHVGGSFYREWRTIMQAADVSAPFSFHDLRRTGASEVDRIDRGLGKVFLQHAPRSHTEISYLNASEELREAVEQMRVPEAFLELIDVEPPRPTRRTDWQFFVDHAVYRGKRLHLKNRVHGRPLAILRALVAAGPNRSLNFDDLKRIVWWDKPDVERVTIKTAMNYLRRSLREQLGLSWWWNPLPWGVDRDGWFLHLP